MQNPYLSKKFQGFAKKKHPREVASLFSTNKQVFHPLCTRKEEAEISVQESYLSSDEL
jgi:hypothetical protein